MGEVRRVVVLSDELLDYQRETPADPLDLVWRAYVALAEDFASFRLSGGWVDRGCDVTFGVRRGPIEVSFGDLSVFADDPALIYLDFHATQFYIVYSPEDGDWIHWQSSPGGTWQKVDGEVVVDASSYWLWNGKLHRAIRSVIMDASPEDISVDETADGNLRIHVTLDESYLNLWEWDPIDKSLDLTLVVDPDTFALEGYTWELHRNPDVYTGSCLTYKEVATDGRLGCRNRGPGIDQGPVGALRRVTVRPDLDGGGRGRPRGVAPYGRVRAVREPPLRGARPVLAGGGWAG